MTINTLSPITELLTQSKNIIIDEWVNDITRIWSQEYSSDKIKPDELRNHANFLINELITTFKDYSGDSSPDISHNHELCTLIKRLSSDFAKKGIKPADSAQFVIALKNLLTQNLVHNLNRTPAELIICLRVIEDVLDRLSLLTFEAYVETREQLISQQSLSLLELSTPVVQLWNNILLLPLVGVIDTVRARQFTERLLEAISVHEAIVTVIDVTGVPVFDTSVARHIMKAIDAAQLLGSKIIMTGISPEAAQTLTKLGISFTNVLSRATLRAGVAEALNQTGRKIVSASGERN